MSEDDKDIILEGINTHSFDSTEKPKSNEAEILWDADKLDSVGCVGIARSFLTAGACNMKIDHLINIGTKNLQRMKFHTKTAREIASERIEYVIDFIDKLKNDLAVDEKGLIDYFHIDRRYPTGGMK